MQRSCYVWNCTSPPVEVHVALEVVQHLSLEALEAFKAIPRRGLEIGGLLLGRTGTRHEIPCLSIDDYIPVPSEHRAGPSYRLSPSDLEQLEQLIRSHPAGIGLYRTQTRAEDISLQEDDHALVKSYFSSGWHLFLMIQPASRTAAIFVTENGTLAAGHQFSFRPADLAMEAVREEFSPPNSPEPEPPQTAAGSWAAAVTMPAREATPARVLVTQTWRKRWLVPAAAMLAGIAGGAALGFLYFLQPQRPAPPAAALAAAPAPEHIALQIQKAGDALHLLWDGNSPAARAAIRGVLQITDGQLHSSMDLDPAELASGLVSYWPTTGDVSFELQTFGPGRSTDDSVSAISPMPPAPAPKVASAAVHGSAALPRKKPTRSAPVESDRVMVEATSPSRPAAPAGKVAPLESPIHEPILTPETAPTPPKPAAAGAAAAKPLPDVSVSAEPVRSSRWGRMVSHIPLLRRLRKPPQDYVPPQPVHQAKPALTARQRRALTEPVPIDVKVYVSEAGRVQYAELISGHNRDLEAAAVYAARRWSFIPARLGGENVPGEMILHFRFGVNQ